MPDRPWRISATLVEWLVDRADRKPFTPKGERQRARLHRVARLIGGKPS